MSVLRVASAVAGDAAWLVARCLPSSVRCWAFVRLPNRVQSALVWNRVAAAVEAQRAEAIHALEDGRERTSERPGP